VIEQHGWIESNSPDDCPETRMRMKRSKLRTDRYRVDGSAVIVACLLKPFERRVLFSKSVPSQKYS
jgi:hypothetical protein